MRIVCDSCQTKYSIGDDKIRGKVFKIRCKKCNHVIIVRGNEGAEAGGAPETPTWYIVRGGQQDGPYASDALQGFLHTGELTPDTYVWKEGFANWAPLSSVGELSFLLAAPASSALLAPRSTQESAALSEMASFAAEPDNSGFDENESTRVASGFFEQQRTPSVDLESTRAAPPPGMDYGAMAAMASAPKPMAAQPAPQPLMAAPQPMMAAPQPAPQPEKPSAGFAGAAPSSAEAGPPLGFGGAFWGTEKPDAGAAKPAAKAAAKAAEPAAKKSDMVGARSENSVLFSLNNLSKESTPKEDEAPVNTEASGLIDIRALSSSAAAVSSGRAGGPAGPSKSVEPFAAGAAPGPAISVPAMMPMGTRKSNAPIFIAIGVGLFLILAVGGGLGAFMIWGRNNDTQQIVMQAPATGAQPDKADGKPEDKADEKADDKAEPKADEKKDEAVAAKEDEKPAEDEKAEDKAAAEEEEKKKAEEEAKAEELRKAEAERRRKEEENLSPEERKKREEERKKLLEEKKQRELELAKAKEDKLKDAKPEEKKDEKGGKKDSIDDILNGIGAPAKKDEPKKEEVVKKDEKQPPPADTGAEKKLTKEEVSGVVKRSYGSVQGCANDKVRGKTATVRFTINPNGSVGAASVVTADVASDPAAGCILRVVRGMKFPSADSSMTINYPFKL